METVESLKGRIQTADDLHAVVRTMKALAAVNIRQLENAVESLAEFRRTVELGFRAVLGQGRGQASLIRNSTQNSLGAIVFGTDQGMCGQLNDQIAAYARDQMESHGYTPENRAVLAIGSRVAGRLEDAGERLQATYSVANSMSGITPLVQDLVMHIDRWFASRIVDHVVVFYCQHLSRASYAPCKLNLLPIDRDWIVERTQERWPTKILPAFTMSPDQLLSSLVRQYLFVSLYRGCAESLASENASRLVAMRGAERNIGDKIEELTRLFHQQRQMAVTEELLDIVVGFEALADIDE